MKMYSLKKWAIENKMIKELLDKVVLKINYLYGIGAGTNVMDSGETVVFEILKDLKGPYCCFDIGSNKGQYLRQLIDLKLNDKVEIHSFEPGKVAFRELKTEFSGHANIKLNNLAIGNQVGKTTLIYDKDGSGLASLTKRRLNHFNIFFNKSEEICINTVDNYCEANSIKHIHLLKIDIEGHELDALFGSAKMFERGAVDLCTFEFGGCNIDTRTFFQDFYYFFSRINMKIYRITPLHALIPIDNYNEVYEQFRTTNYLAIRNGL